MEYRWQQSDLRAIFTYENVQRGLLTHARTDRPESDGPRATKSGWTATMPLAEVKHRTDVVGIFPNEAAIWWLVSVVRLEQNDKWAAQRPLHASVHHVLLARSIVRRAIRYCTDPALYPNRRSLGARSYTMQRHTFQPLTVLDDKIGWKATARKGVGGHASQMVTA